MIKRLAARLTPRDPFEARARIELLRVVARHQRGLLLGIPVTSAALALMDAIWIHAGLAFAWYATLLTTAGVAFLSNERLIRGSPRPEDAGLWTLKIMAGTTPIFVVWPAMIPLAWVDGNAANNLFLCVFMLTTLTMGTVLFGAFFPMGVLHNGLILPFAALYSIEYEPSMPWLGPVVQVVFGFVMTGLCADVARAAREAVELQLRNEQLIRELAAERDRADRANQAKSGFLAAMSHDLRTPLNGIIGYAELIGRGMHGPVNPPKYAGYVENISACGRHLLTLIDEVLDLAKVEAGKRELEKETFDVAGLAAEAVAFVETQAAKGGVAVAFDIDDAAALTADRRAVMQIVTNMLSNAVKFTKTGGRVVVFARRAGQRLHVGVEDTGAGMTPEGLKKALEPFGQASRMTTVEGRGTGLGLPIVKALIEAHGASFHIESTAGVGTKVWGEFPAASAGAAKALAEAEAA